MVSWPVGLGSVVIYSGKIGAVLHTFVGIDGVAQFGSSLDAARGVNADGYDDVIVGAPLDWGSGQFAGRARLLWCRWPCRVLAQPLE
ncbi:MAG: hypothetical protein ACI841_003346 [Planctomycetota bacterium]|jgi:hypothetical protein